MTKRLLWTLALLAYCFVLIKVMVFKDIPTFKVGDLMLNFGGTEPGGTPNFVPFTTIIPYLFGRQGWIIAGINLVGNVGLLVPVGLLLPLIVRTITWRTAIVAGVAFGLAIELMQLTFNVGRFDIDDVILNALGVLVGYWLLLLLLLASLVRAWRSRARN